MRRPNAPTLHVAATLAAGLVLSACSTLTGDAGAGLTGLGTGDLAARADGVEITAADLDAAVDTVVDAGALTSEQFVGTDLERRVQLQTDILTNEVHIAIVEHVAERDLDVVVTEAEVQARLDDAIAASGGQEAFEEQLAANGSNLELFTQGERIQALLAEVTEALTAADPITDEEVRAQYEQRAAEFEQVSASHILVETEAAAQDVLARLEAGEDFAALATELSTDTGSAQNGGSLGLAPRGSFVPEFEAAIWDGPAEVGAILGPVQTQFGFHVIRVDEFVVTPEDEALEQIRAELDGTRGQEIFGAWFSQAVADADPEVAARFGRWDRTAQRVVRDDDQREQAGL